MMLGNIATYRQRTTIFESGCMSGLYNLSLPNQTCGAN